MSGVDPNVEAYRAIHGNGVSDVIRELAKMVELLDGVQGRIDNAHEAGHVRAVVLTGRAFLHALSNARESM